MANSKCFSVIGLFFGISLFFVSCGQKKGLSEDLDHWALGTWGDTALTPEYIIGENNITYWPDSDSTDSTLAENLTNIQFTDSKVTGKKADGKTVIFQKGVSGSIRAAASVGSVTSLKVTDGGTIRTVGSMNTSGINFQVPSWAEGAWKFKVKGCPKAKDAFFFSDGFMDAGTDWLPSENMTVGHRLTPDSGGVSGGYHVIEATDSAFSFIVWDRQIEYYRQYYDQAMEDGQILENAGWLYSVRDNWLNERPPWIIRIEKVNDNEVNLIHFFHNAWFENRLDQKDGFVTLSEYRAKGYTPILVDDVPILVESVKNGAPFPLGRNVLKGGEENFFINYNTGFGREPSWAPPQSHTDPKWGKVYALKRIGS